MRKLLIGALVILLLPGAFMLSSCSKKSGEAPLVITPTVTPVPYSVMVYLVTPTDKSFSPDFYRAARSCMQSLQSWYKTQLGKTFVLNPVIVDTITAMHNSTWFNTNNGDSISGADAFAWHNTYYEMQQLLGNKFDTTHITYFAFVNADFGEETKPRGLAAQGLNNLTGLASQYPNGSTGADGHALAHAFGLPEPQNPLANGIMSTGYTNWPNCVFTTDEASFLTSRPFLQ